MSLLRQEGTDGLLEEEEEELGCVGSKSSANRVVRLSSEGGWVCDQFAMPV